MVEQIISYLTQLIISVISHTGYFGIFILMTAESALVPIPSEITMPFAGYLITLGRFNFILIVLIGALANLFGSIISYGLGFWGQEPVVRQLIKKYGKFLLISEDEFANSEKWFRKYGEKIVFFSRVLPIVRTFISLPAGIAEMNFWKFSYLTFLGSLIWSFILTYIGYVLGKNWNTIDVYYRKFEYIILFAGILLVGWYIYHKIAKIKRKTK